MKLNETDLEGLISNVRDSLSKARLEDFEKEQYVNSIEEILRQYKEHLNEDSELRYRIHKRAVRMEVILYIKGEKWDPFEQGTDAADLNIKEKISSLSFDNSSAMSYHYIRGYNILALRSPSFHKHRNILKQPMIWAMVLGIVAGLICRFLPPAVSDFIVDDIASPVLSVVLRLMTGIMGPVIFLSLIVAINTLEGINELNQMGFKLLWRFVKVALFCAIISIIVGILFFGGLAKGVADFEPRMIVDLLLSIIPTSLISPFVENNIPQLVVLGIGLGAVLLLLGQKTSGLATHLEQLKIWLNELMNLVLKIIIIVPFLSIFKIIAKKQEAQFLEGWKYIVGSYICLIVCLAVKLIKTSIRSKASIAVLLHKLKPVFLTVFAAGSELVALRASYDDSKNKLGIREDFTSFWIPMNQALLAPSSTIGFGLAPFLVAKLTGTPVSLSFLLVLLVVIVELSLASPGLSAGWTITFTSLGMSAEYVGVFSAYGVFIKNAAAGFGITYRLLEEIEAACVLDKIDKQVLQDKECGMQA